MITAFKNRDGRRTKILHLLEVRIGTVSFGKVPLVNTLLGDYLDVCMVEPIAVSLKITDFGKGCACRHGYPGRWQAVFTTMILLHHTRELDPGQVYRNAGPLGTVFQGRIVKTLPIGEFDGIVGQIRGNAQITGYHQFVIDGGDPFPEGFLL